MSVIRRPLQAIRDISPFLLTAVAILAGIVFLFAFPLITAALALAVPLLMVGTVGAFALWMNARTSMWHGRRPFFFAVADWGFLGCFAAFAAYGFANVESSAQMIAYVFVGVIFIAAARFAFMEFEAWWLGLAFSAIMLAITGEYLVFTLPHPEWFFDFSASVLIAISLALVVGGSVVSHFHGRRADATDEAPAWGKTAPRVLAGVVLVLLALPAVATITAQTTVEAEDFMITLEWDGWGLTGESTLPVEAGEYRVLIRNNDLTVHTFTWLRLEQVNCIVNRMGQETCETATYPTGMDFAIGPGSERIVTFILGPGVEYELTCAVPGHMH